MKRVAEEWRDACRRVRIDYEQEVGEILSSHDSEFLKILARYIRKRALILEAGCGYGAWCIYFNKYHGSSCVGIDIVTKPLRALKSHLKNPPHMRPLQ